MPIEVKISGMGFMGLEDYYGTVVSQEGDHYIIDLGEPCPIHGKIVKIHKMWVTCEKKI